MICAYIRVSTDEQTTENQRFEIENWCHSRGIHAIEKWVSDDGVSGAKDYKKRKLGTLMSELSDGDTLIASEISRFGRDLLMVMEILRALMDKHIKVYTVKDNFVLSDEIQCKVIAFAFGLAAEIERNLIRQRTKAALDRLRAEGKRLGRPKNPAGAKTYYALKGKEAECIEMLKSGVEKKVVCESLGVDRATINRFLKITGNEQYIGESKKKIDLNAEDIEACIEKGYSLAQAARSLGVSEASVRKYADEFMLVFKTTDYKTVYNFLDSKIDEIKLKHASGMTFKAIREELRVSPACWSVWMRRSGLHEIRTMDEARKKEIEIKTLLTNGLSVKQISIALHIKQSIVKRIAFGDTTYKRTYLRDLSVAEREIARQNGISDKALCTRLSVGWSVVDAINTKIVPREKRHI